MSTLRERLRALPSFPSDLPVLEISSAPHDPDALFRAWLDDAIASGARQPHAMSLATLASGGAGEGAEGDAGEGAGGHAGAAGGGAGGDAGAAGGGAVTGSAGAGRGASDPTSVARTLILKDIDEHGYLFSTTRGSKKSTELAEHPRASMLFFWRESGRQVRITGSVTALDDAAAQADWRERPSYTGRPNPEWMLYALEADEYEFMQARLDRKHTRLGYRRTAGGWMHAAITTPAG